jgi:hypothetical protein
MTLTEFAVLHAHHDHGGTIIHSFAGRELVLALVPREALGDHFNWPKPGRDQCRPSLSECNLVVDRNLAAFEPIIQAKYQQGQYVMFHRAGSSLKMITVDHADLERSGVQLSDSVIDMARATRFVRA